MEQNYFGVPALQGTLGDNIDYQVAPFSRYSTVSFYPDYEGDLIYNGASSKVFRSDWGNGVQADSAYHGFKDHTIRLGTYIDSERAEIDNHEAAFPTAPLSATPKFVVDNIGLQTWIYSVYLQDEWKPFKQLTINVGARFDLYDGLLRADQASPRVGLEYTPIRAPLCTRHTRASSPRRRPSWYRSAPSANSRTPLARQLPVATELLRWSAIICSTWA